MLPLLFVLLYIYALHCNITFFHLGGMILTGFVQFCLEDKALTSEHWAAVVFATTAIYLHSKFPYNHAKTATETSLKVKTKLI